jgi:hypothetical protein
MIELLLSGNLHTLLHTLPRSVDMVFCVTGMVRVALHVRKFHKNDRIGVTISLAQEILLKGWEACLALMSLDIPPSRFLSSFPDFPTTYVSGNIFRSSA